MKPRRGTTGHYLWLEARLEDQMKMLEKCAYALEWEASLQDNPRPRLLEVIEEVRDFIGEPI
jgi:hypothetical protein